MGAREQTKGLDGTVAMAVLKWQTKEHRHVPCCCCE